MKISQSRQIDRFKRSLEFVDKHSKDFAPDSSAMVAQEQLKDVVARAESSAAEPATSKSGRRVYRSDKLVALNALRAQLNRVARTAEVIASKDPSFKNNFEMPDKRRKEELAKAARHFIKELPKVSDKFAVYEMGKDDVQKLQTALDNYEQVQAVPAAKPAKSPRTPGSSNPIVDEGMKLVNTLDVIMHNRYDEDEKSLQNWMEVSALEVTKRRRKTKDGE